MLCFCKRHCQAKSTISGFSLSLENVLEISDELTWPVALLENWCMLTLLPNCCAWYKKQFGFVTGEGMIRYGVE